MREKAKACFDDFDAHIHIHAITRASVTVCACRARVLQIIAARGVHWRCDEAREVMDLFLSLSKGCDWK